MVLVISISKNDCFKLIVYCRVLLRIFSRLRGSTLCGDLTTLKLEREHGLFFLGS